MVGGTGEDIFDARDGEGDFIITGGAVALDPADDVIAILSGLPGDPTLTDRLDASAFDDGSRDIVNGADPSDLVLARGRAGHRQPLSRVTRAGRS